MISTLGYANTFATLTGFAFLLNIEQYIKKNNKTKLIYAVFTYMLLVGIILSDSKAVWGLLVLAIIVAFFTLKEKKQKIEYIESIIVGGIFAMLCANQVGQSIKQETAYLAWLYYILFGALTAIGIWFIQKQNTKIEKLDNKKILIGLVALIIIVIVIIIVGLFLTKPLVLFANKATKEVKYKVAGIQANKEYELEFDIEAVTQEEKLNIYEILIEEENKYNDKVEKHSIYFRKFNGTKKITFKTTDQTTEIAVIIKSMHPSLQEKLVLKEFRINGKEEALNYYYLPRNVVQKIQSLFYTNKSVSERIIFLQDGLKIVKQNWICGSGANAWRYQQDEVQQYYYKADQMHSFPLKLWMDFGIVAIVCYLIMIGYLIYNIIKQKEERIPKVALLFLIIHSMSDFEMSFGICLVIFIIYFALQMPKSKEIGFNIIAKIGIILGLIIPVYFTAITAMSLYIPNEEIASNLSKQIPYSTSYEEAKIKKALKTNKWENVRIEELKKQLDSIPNYQSQLCTKILEKEASEENIKYVYEKMENWMQRQTLQIENNIYLNEEISEIAKTYNQSQFYELICTYYNKNSNEIQNQEKNRCNKVEIERCQEILDSIYQEAKEKV